MRCRVCRAPLEKGLRFCRACGAPARAARKRLIRRMAVGALVCALATAFLWYPALLSAVAPRAYLSLALSRAEGPWRREWAAWPERLGPEIWETLSQGLSDSSLTAELTRLDSPAVESAEYAARLNAALSGLRLRTDTRRDNGARTLKSRGLLALGEKNFPFDTAFTADEIALHVPALWNGWLSVRPDGLGDAWNASFVSTLFRLPDGLSPDFDALFPAPGAVESRVSRREEIEGRAGALWAAGTLRARPAKDYGKFGRVRPWEAALPGADCAALLHSLLAEPETRGRADVWGRTGEPAALTRLREILDGAEWADAALTLYVGGGHRLALAEVVWPCVFEGRAYTLRGECGIAPDAPDSLYVLLALEAEGETAVSLSLDVSLTPETLRAEAEIRTAFDGTPAFDAALAGTLREDGAFELSGGRGDAHMSLSGTYRPDARRGSVSLSVDRIQFGDEHAEFTVEGHFTYERRPAGADWTEDPAGARPLFSFGWREQDAFLESYYRFFADTPLYDPYLY